MPEGTPERVEQLHEGVHGAAASLAEAHAALAERAASSADRLRVVSRALDPSGEEARAALPEMVERLEALHYALLRVAVLEEEPGEAGLQEEIEATDRLAERLEGRVGAADLPGAPSGSPGESREG